MWQVCIANSSLVLLAESGLDKQHWKNTVRAGRHSSGGHLFSVLVPHRSTQIRSPPGVGVLASGPNKSTRRARLVWVKYGVYLVEPLGVGCIVYGTIMSFV